MTGSSVIQTALGGTQWLLTNYLGDFTDADMFVRPVTSANHAAWQLGHLLESERSMLLSQLPDAKMPELPAGFQSAMSAESAKADGPAGFLNKANLVSLFDAIRAATIAAVAGLSDADLDKPTTGSMAPFAPTLGAFLMLISNHTLMHAGQFVVVRRQLGKPILM